MATLDAGDHVRYLIAKGQGAAHWPAPDWGLRLRLRAPMGGSAAAPTPTGISPAPPTGGGPDLRERSQLYSSSLAESFPEHQHTRLCGGEHF